MIKGSYLYSILKMQMVEKILSDEFSKICLSIFLYTLFPEVSNMEKVSIGPMPYMNVMSTILVGANVSGKPNT